MRQEDHVAYAEPDGIARQRDEPARSPHHGMEAGADERFEAGAPRRLLAVERRVRSPYAGRSDHVAEDIHVIQVNAP
ncbi:MAG TPA: hypothetical protein VGM10_19465 [Actinocrinis sp.]